VKVWGLPSSTIAPDSFVWNRINTVMIMADQSITADTEGIQQGGLGPDAVPFTMAYIQKKGEQHSSDFKTLKANGGRSLTRR